MSRTLVSPSAYRHEEIKVWKDDKIEALIDQPTSNRGREIFLCLKRKKEREREREKEREKETETFLEIK